MISDRDGTIGGPARGNLSGDRCPADRINPNRAAAAGNSLSNSREWPMESPPSDNKTARERPPRENNPPLIPPSEKIPAEIPPNAKIPVAIFPIAMIPFARRSPENRP